MADIKCVLLFHCSFISDYCPIPLPMEYLKSNYTYWKSQTPDSPSNSASEEDVSYAHCKHVIIVWCV